MTSALDMSDPEYVKARDAIVGRISNRRYSPPAVPSAESELARAASNLGMLIPSVLESADLAAVRAGPDLAQAAAAEVRRLRAKYPLAFAPDVRELDQAAYQAQKRAMVRR
jgi:hypothetical protein